MKKIWLLIFVVAMILVSCGDISNENNNQKYGISEDEWKEFQEWKAEQEAE